MSALLECIGAAAGRRRRHRALAAWSTALLVPAGTAWWLGWPLSAMLIALAAIVAVTVVWFAPRPTDAQRVARHLDDRFPELEDSSALLLRPSASLSGLGREQKRRVRQRLEGLGRRLDLADVLAPGDRGLLVPPAAIGGLLLAALLVATLLPPGEPRVGIRVTPPAYTGIEPFTTGQLDVTVPQDSLVSWTLEAPYTLQAAHWVSDDRRIALAGGERSWTMSMRAEAEMVYWLEWAAEGSGRRTSPAAITLRHDQPPEIEISEPVADTVETTDPVPVHFLVHATDDHGLGDVHLLATLASGKGESVTFRDQRLPLVASGDAWRGQVRPGALEMQPGDELYLRAVAVDNRDPRPQRAVTRAVIYRWLDPDAAERGLLSGMPVDRMPEYFRSQRQIIIDTERLIADRRDLSEPEFQERSRALAFDQRALRMRYGQYLGEEESVEFSAVPGGESEHDHPEEESARQQEPQIDVVELFGHSHDSAEQATLFDEETRGTLKGALAAMWDAELQLSLHRPDDALPFEYDALNQLKAVQHANRIFVERVGFEPPPLEETKRLTGDLDGASAYRTRAPEADDPDAGRALLAALLTDSDELPAQLERFAAGAQTAQPRLLARRLLADGNCRSCRTELITLLWQSVEPPPAPPTATAPVSSRR